MYTIWKYCSRARAISISFGILDGNQCCSGIILDKLKKCMNKEEIVGRLDSLGCKMNSRRLQILEDFLVVGQITDVEEFWISVREKLPVSWATVHNFLNTLCLYGILEKENHEGRNKRYRLKTYCTAAPTGSIVVKN